MSQETTIDCWQCKEPMTLAERSDCDGCCPGCGSEVDIEGYLVKVLKERDQLRAEVEALRSKIGEPELFAYITDQLRNFRAKRRKDDEMIVWAVMLDYSIKKVLFGSAEMYKARNISFSESEAKAWAEHDQKC